MSTRINKFVAKATGYSRRFVDELIKNNQVTINGSPALIGDYVSDTDHITIQGKQLESKPTRTILMNKPVGYVCSKNGQGSKTIYDLLPSELQHLKTVGRLDKNSSGLILLTSDGDLSNQLTHPSNQKTKHYLISLNKPLDKPSKDKIQNGIKLDDGLSRLKVNGLGKNIEVILSEGRNRQIRRTFEAAGYKVTKLHRIKFASFKLDDIKEGKFIEV